MAFLGNILKAVLVVLLSILVWRILKFLRKHREWRKATNSPHITVLGPLHPLWGSLYLFSSLSEYFELVTNVLKEKRPKLLCAWTMFFYPSFAVCHPDTAKILYKSSTPKAVAVGGAYRYIKDWIGDGLLVSSGKKWERNRRLLTPGFHFEILKPYVNIYNRVSDIFLEKLSVFAKKKEAVDIFPHVTLTTLDTILRCAFSYEGNVQEEGQKHPYVNAVTRLSHLVLSRCLKPWFQIDFIHRLSSEGREYKELCDYSHDFSMNIIRQRKKTLKTEGMPTKRHLDFLDILLTAKDENGEGLSDEDIRAEADTFMFEGHDTTAAAISWAIYCLGKYPTEQEIVYNELTVLLRDKTDVTWENLSQMPKLTAFIKESMRMFAPVPGTSRLLTSPMTFGNCVVPAGVHIDIVIHLIHHHPDVWPEPETFKPERFLDEDFVERHPYSYIPFAAGTRNCIGQHFAMNEIKVVLSRLVHRFKVSLVDGHAYEINPEVVMRAKYGIKVNLENRI